MESCSGNITLLSSVNYIHRLNLINDIVVYETIRTLYYIKDNITFLNENDIKNLVLKLTLIRINTNVDILPLINNLKRKLDEAVSN